MAIFTKALRLLKPESFVEVSNIRKLLFTEIAFYALLTSKFSRLVHKA